MLDDVEDFDDSAAFLDELDELALDEPLEPITLPGGGRIFGMSPFQRFFIAFELFFLACVLSSLCLLIFDKISPPF